MKFSKTICIILAAIMMIAVFAIPASAYQTAFKKGATVTTFSQTAKDKMAAMKDGDNIFALGSYDTATYKSAAAYTESGLAQFVYQHNDGWGRAIKRTDWSINGMAQIGDGIIDCPLDTKSAGGLWFSRTNANTDKIDADANVSETGKYLTLCGWEFADDFRVKGFKIYFNKAAVADDFDILIGHVEGDNIIWEVAFEGNDLSPKFTDVPGTTNKIVSYTADFVKPMNGRFIQIATKSYDCMDTSTKENQAGYVCAEFEVYAYVEAGHVHSFAHVAKVDPTCEGLGVAAHYACECGAKATDAEGKNIVEDAALAIPAKGHNLPDTCDANHQFICKDCGKYVMDPDTLKITKAELIYGATPTVKDQSEILLNGDPSMNVGTDGTDFFGPKIGTSEALVLKVDGADKKYLYAIKAELTDISKVGAVAVYMHGYKSGVMDNNFDILVSADGENWKTIAVCTDMATGTLEQINDATKPYHYNNVKIAGNDGSGSSKDQAASFVLNLIDAEEGVKYVAYASHGGRTNNSNYSARFTEFAVYAAAANPDTADSFDAVTFSVILAVSLVGALAAGYTVIRRRKEN